MADNPMRITAEDIVAAFKEVQETHVAWQYHGPGGGHGMGDDLEDGPQHDVELCDIGWGCWTIDGIACLSAVADCLTRKLREVGE